jgi:hypothetical protein
MKKKDLSNLKRKIKPPMSNDWRDGYNNLAESIKGLIKLLEEDLKE